MCGIVGAVAERNVAPILIQGLQRLEYRGYDSAGVAIVQSDGTVQRRREVGKVVNLSDNLEADPVKGSLGIAHTRWATHGAVQQTNTHPHMSRNDLALVHNGIIENYMTLREELQSKGYVFASETDSETIVHLIHSRLGDDGLLQAVRRAVKRLEGAYAIAVCWADEPDRIIAARSGCPLVVGKGIGENFLASDVLALKAVTDRFIFLEEGDLVELHANDNHPLTIYPPLQDRAVPVGPATDPETAFDRYPALQVWTSFHTRSPISVHLPPSPWQCAHLVLSLPRQQAVNTIDTARAVDPVSIPSNL